MVNNKKEGFFILCGGLFLILLVILMNNFDIKLICIFNHMTGLLCPGCGTTRMLKSLFRLKIKEAFMFNPLVFCLLPFLGIYFFDRLLILLFNRKSFISKRVSIVFWNTTLIITIIFGILRNIPLFDFLRP